MAVKEKPTLKGLRPLREARGLSQTRLARVVGIAQPWVSLLESTNSVPRAETLHKLAEALGVEVADLFREEPEEARPVPKVAPSLLWILREMQAGYEVEGTLDGYSSEALKRIAGLIDSLALRVFTREFDAVDDVTLQELALRSAKVRKLLLDHVEAAPEETLEEKAGEVEQRTGQLEELGRLAA
ncbi:MAG TPA: helix-turn-helix transcriptional regulator [Rubrobacter sp.]|nr:helix-turn-helix transcriptional regulator [Rubrobacter sp.]